MPLIVHEAALQRQYDICIVGAGPAGLAAAFSLKNGGLSVLVVECGTEVPVDSNIQGVGSIGRTHAPLAEVSTRALGGTSWKWGGRIMPISQADFADYDWPLAHADYTEFLAEAACFLNGPKDNATLETYFADTPADLNAFEKMTAYTSVAQTHRDRIRDPHGPDIVLSIEVTGLLMQSDPASDKPRCAGVTGRCADSDEPVTFTAGTVILAAGGLSTTRLLLAAQSRSPQFLGHLTELGAYYTGHLTGSVASIIFRAGQDIQEFGWRSRPDGSFSRRVFHFARTRNCGAGMIFWAKNKPLGDATHGSAVLSAKHLLTRLRNRRPSTDDPDGPRIVNRRVPTPIPGHLWNILRDGPSAIGVTNKMMKARRATNRPRMDYLVPNRTNSYRLCYHSEHLLNRNNRITLAESAPPDRLPGLRIEFEFSENDIEAVQEGHLQLARELETSRIARIAYTVEKSKLAREIRQSAMDGYHQIGTTRMGRNASDSVVDAQCRVHGVEGLYIASSSTFRSATAVPPTLSIVAFSLRLARHLTTMGRKS